jgi:DNA-binding CsgD family transcriptional regulator
MQALALFTMLMAVLVGILGLGTLARFGRDRTSPEAVWSYRTFLAFNILLIGGIASRYLEYHLESSFSPWSYGLIQLSLLSLLIPLKVAFLFCLERAGASLSGQLSELPKVGWLRGTFLVVGVAVIIVGMVLFAAGAPGSAFELHTWFELVVVGALLLVALLQVRAAALISQSPFRRRALLYFSLLHVVSFFFPVFLLLLASRLRVHADVLWSGSLMFLYNVLLLSWGHRYLPLLGSTPQVSESIQRLIQEFGITPRELEVIGLISKGLSNQEIADTLFISIQTVKDHNHNIFRKTGVTNRVQLANLFRRSPLAS